MLWVSSRPLWLAPLDGRLTGPPGAIPQGSKETFHRLTFIFLSFYQNHSPWNRKSKPEAADAGTHEDFHHLWKTSPRGSASRVSKVESLLTQRDASRDTQSAASSSSKSLVTTQSRVEFLGKPTRFTADVRRWTGLHVSLPCACRVTLQIRCVLQTLHVYWKWQPFIINRCCCFFFFRRQTANRWSHLR